MKNHAGVKIAKQTTSEKWKMKRIKAAPHALHVIVCIVLIAAKQLVVKEEIQWGKERSGE
jgi:hypothetical protein